MFHSSAKILSNYLRKEISDQITNCKDFSSFELEVKLAIDRGIEILGINDTNYPYRLKQIPDAPLLLYKKGHGELSPSRSIAIVGTRKMTDYGRETTRVLLNSLKQFGIHVYSGLAYGVDVTAHKYCLDLAIPTSAILGHGLDRVYPAAHRSVARAIQSTGNLISEFALGTVAAPINFPKRNRIIAAMVDLVIVVESNEKGGSLITAELANGYNREVMAVPGPVNWPTSVGCNRLIKTQAAHLLQSAEDISTLMGWTAQPSKQPPPVLTEEESFVIEHVGDQAIQLDDLAMKCNLDVHLLSAILLSLELKNCISSLPANRYKRR